MADYLNNKGLRGGERAYTQVSATINIFNQRLALKKEVTIFIKQRKEDYKDEYLYKFVLQELFKEDFKGFTKEVFEKVRKSKILGLRLLLRIYRVQV